MYQIETGGKKFKIAFDADGTSSGSINGKDFEIDVIETGNGAFHILRNHKSYQAEVVKFDAATKEIEIKIEGIKYRITAKDRYDVLLEKLGFDTLNSLKATDLVAPMPGLVLDIQVKAGDQVQKGDTLVILEAMKMENILKAGSDAEIGNCLVKIGDSVEKNEKLITFKS